MIRFAANYPPLDSQSAQNLFSSSANNELRTAWYLSTSFTDLPVITLFVKVPLLPSAVRAGVALPVKQKKKQRLTSQNESGAKEQEER